MRTLLTIVLFVFVLKASAQYDVPEKEYCDEFKNRTLAVELIAETDDNTQNLNKSLQEIFKNNWSWSEIEFLPSSKIDEILGERNPKYIVLRQEASSREDIRSGYVDQNGMRHHVGMGGAGSTPYSYVAFSFAYYHFHMMIPMGKKLRDVTTIGMASGDLSSIDYLYVVQQLNRLIKASIEETPMNEYYNVDRNIQKCKDMDLYILKDFIKDEEKSAIGDFYTNKFELVDYNTYEDAILNRTKGVAYTKIIWANQLKMYAWVVVNAENGETLSLLTFGGVKFGRSHEANDIIKVKHLKYIENKMGQNFNNKYK